MDKAVDILNEYEVISDIYVKFAYLRDTYNRCYPDPKLPFEEFIAKRSVETENLCK